MFLLGIAYSVFGRLTGAFDRMDARSAQAQ